MLTLEKFEEASEAVKNVILPTNLIYSEYYSAQTGGKIYLKPRICSIPEHIKCVGHITKSVP